jgi:predicted Ser/Thr protein kinase
MTRQSRIESEFEDLQEKVNLITTYQKPYIADSLKSMAQKTPSNVKVICDYIITEQNEINIKESTKEGKLTDPSKADYFSKSFILIHCPTLCQ